MQKILLMFSTAVLATVAGGATVMESSVEMKTYPFFDPDPVPATDKTRYPYFFFDGTSATNALRRWKTVVLENDRIRVTMLPEIGGKVWGAQDKRTGRDFIYHNHVVKFRNISQRGPWCSGGIEFNFGIIGHGPWTATPVSYFVRTNGDASVSCFVSETELVTMTTWQVEVNLKDGEDGFTTRTVWYNGSGFQAPYYQWMNAAFSTRGDPSFEYPGSAYIGHDGVSHAWPVDPDGHDLSKHGENAFGGPKSEHVVNGDNGFYGIWWPGAGGRPGFGALHRNHVTQKYGRKVWLWPLSREGAIWEDLLTDEDGQYAELQSGRAFNQPEDKSYLTPFKHPTFAPGTTDIFEEEWRVVRDRSVFDRTWDRSAYVERPQAAPADFDWNSAYGHYLAGEQKLRQRFDRKAEPELLKAIAKEPYFVPALDQLALLAVRRAQYGKAHEFAAKALSVNTYDAAANYADGLAFLADGNLCAAKERLGLAAYSPEFRSAAYSAVARTELREGNPEAAGKMADLALVANALDFDARLAKIVVARLSGRPETAASLAGRTLDELPLFHAARYEKGLADGDPLAFTRHVRNELPQETYLSLGTWYEEAGLLDDAGRFFALAGERSLVGLVRQAHVTHLQGEEDAARKLLADAAGRSVAFALPFRRETLPALEWACAEDPSWKFAYLKAVLMAALCRDADSADLLASCGDAPDEAVFYLYRARSRKGDEALADIRRAAALGRSWRVGHALYAHFAAEGDWTAALEAVESCVKDSPANLLNIDYANALVKCGRAEDAVAFMERTTFLPSEHGDNASAAWIDAGRMIAEKALAGGDRAAAEKAVRKALSYPENLGVGRPYELDFKSGGSGRRNPLADWKGELRALAEEAGRSLATIVIGTGD